MYKLILVRDKWRVNAFIRDVEDVVVAAGVWSIFSQPDVAVAKAFFVAVAEAIALKMGLRFAKYLFFTKIEAETDSLLVAKAIALFCHAVILTKYFCCITFVVKKKVTLTN